jgi:N-acetylmuramoyl-L-alanine amidase
MRRINKIIVHCTATPEGREVTVAEVDKWHRARGFDGIGYHYLIGLNGVIHFGRPDSKVGAHCEGQNANSIGICYVGGLAADGKTPKDTRTAAQKAALIVLIGKLKKEYPDATVHGHREFAAKACPCFDAKNEYK